MNLHNKGVVITGAASGIGQALAHALAAHGARLLLADIDLVRLETVAQAVRAQGAVCLTAQCDVAQAAALQTLADTAQREWSGADVLINNAGVALVAPVQSLDLADAHWLMNINFWGVVHGCQAFLPQMQARPGSVMVNISSIFAMVSAPTQSIYNASKAAVRGFSDALREEVRASGVRVLCVHPGGIRTRIVQQARLRDISMTADSPQALNTQFEQSAPTSPEQAAAAIVNAVLTGQTRLLIGRDARLGDLLARLFPTRVSGWLVARARKRRLSP
ncbi:MAG: hypothetical protein RLZZ401_249 [Pseudomonadota bacterium]